MKPRFAILPVLVALLASLTPLHACDGSTTVQAGVEMPPNRPVEAAGTSGEDEVRPTEAADADTQTTSDSTPVATAGDSDEDDLGRLKEAPLEPYQDQLLEIAIEACSKMPLVPHHKNRARVQEHVVVKCLELDQPQRALRYLKQIKNWRRGACYADLAFYTVRHGSTTDVQMYLDLAHLLSEEEADWRRDRIRVKIAKTNVLLGRHRDAARMEEGVEDSESGKVDAARAMTLEEAQFEGHLHKLEVGLATQNFDLIRNALGACAEMFNRFYHDAERRSLVEDKVMESLETMPAQVRIETLSQMAEFAIDHEDQVKALELVNEAHQYVGEAMRWRLKDRIQLMGQLARLRARAGDKEGARRQADAALELFKSNRDSIVNIYRAEGLRRVAEAYQALGDAPAALEVYRLAIEEGVANPNSRPRAEDLAKTCSSMAVVGAEPDADLWARIRQINEELSDPW